MAQPKRGILSGSEWDIGGHDDVDAIAYAWRRRAIAEREVSQAGLLRSLSHPAFYEDDAFFEVVIDRGLVDSFAAPRSREKNSIVTGVEAELRGWLVGRDVGKQQRARYALIRFFGPDVDVVSIGLGGLDGGARSEKRAKTTSSPETILTVLRALTDPIATMASDDDDSTRDREPMFARLPGSLLPLVHPLLKPKEIAKLVKVDESGFQTGRLVTALMRIDSPEVPAALVEALDVEEIRGWIVRALELGTAKGKMRLEPSAPIRARFDKAMTTIEQSRKAGLPNRVEMAVGGAIATLVRHDAEMARCAARAFDLIPGFKSPSPEVVTPFAELIAASIDTLTPEQLEQIAKLINPKERLVATAAAWVRLDVDRAKTIATRFREGDRAAEDERWQAMARAHLAWEKRNPAIAALIPERAMGAVIAENAKDAPSEIASSVLLELIKKARNPAELLLAVRPASARREQSVARAVLAKLRDTPFKIDAELESLLPPLFGTDVEDWVEQEIDGENPFRDRREALKRALAKARN